MDSPPLEDIAIMVGILLLYIVGGGLAVMCALLSVILVCAPFVYLLFSWVRRNGPRLHAAAEFNARHVDGRGPQQEAWQAAGEILGLAVTVQPETQYDFAQVSLAGEIDHHVVRVWVRRQGDRRYTVTEVEGAPIDLKLPPLPAPLTRSTRQGKRL